MIIERRGAADAGGEEGVRALIGNLVCRLRGDGDGLRNETDLIHPAAIREQRAAGIFRVGPEQRLRVRAEGVNFFLPVHVARDAGLLRAID